MGGRKGRRENQVTSSYDDVVLFRIQLIVRIILGREIQETSEPIQEEGEVLETLTVVDLEVGHHDDHQHINDSSDHNERFSDDGGFMNAFNDHHGGMDISSI